MKAVAHRRRVRAALQREGIERAGVYVHRETLTVEHDGRRYRFPSSNDPAQIALVGTGPDDEGSDDIPSGDVRVALVH